MDAKRKWREEHWFWRGFQSAVFLYAQCGPCLAWRESRRQKKQYKLERQERARHTDQPGIIRQPAPREVNPSWEEEILLGPGPVKKGRKRTNTKASNETSSSGTLVASERAGGSMRSIGDSKQRPLFWNLNRFQRPDEEYIYVDSTDQTLASEPGLIRKGSSVGVGAWVVDAQQPPEKPKRTYTPTTNMPPVNELHPPVVSPMPIKKEDRLWMTAPPPSSSFMHGKKPATTRPRSGSGNSSLQTRGSDAQLNRSVGQKIMEVKLLNGGQASNGVEARPSSRRADQKPSYDRLPKARTNSTSPFRLARETTPTLPTKAKENRPSALRLDSDRPAKTTSAEKCAPIGADASSSSDPSFMRQARATPTYDSVTKPEGTAKAALNLNSIPLLAKDEASVVEPTNLSATPSLSLSSILELSRNSNTAKPTTSPSIVDTYTSSPRKRKDTLGTNARIFVKDSSLHILQDVVDPSALLNSQWAKSPAIEARMPLPPDDSPHKENAKPNHYGQRSAKEQLLMDEGVRRWSWTA